MRKNFVKVAATALAVAVALTPAMSARAAEETYTTERGDNLSKISKKVYGTEDNWKAIYERNKDTIKDPNLIWTNQQLILPDTVAVVTPETQVQQEETTVPETQAQQEQTTVQSQAAETAALSDTQQWIDALYNALLKDDVETVISLFGSGENVKTKCAPYAVHIEEGLDFSDNKYYDTVYHLTASNGVVFGVEYVDPYLGEDGRRYGDYAVGYICNGDLVYVDSFDEVYYGRYSIKAGDHCVEYGFSIGYYHYIKDGYTCIQSTGNSFTLNPDTHLDDYFG